MNTTSSEPRKGDTSGDTISFQEAAVLLDLTEDELQYLIKNSQYMMEKVALILRLVRRQYIARVPFPRG